MKQFFLLRLLEVDVDLGQWFGIFLGLLLVNNDVCKVGTRVVMVR
jgi:hypothetical protein